LAVPALPPVPGVNATHAGTPDAVTVAFGVPPVATASFSALPAAITVAPVTEMVAELELGVTLFDGDEAAPAPSALVALTVKV
jgi:hypothetical protein